MQANYYLDIRILESSDDGELTLAHLRNQIYNIVHGVFRTMPEKFALALELSPRQQRKMQAKALKYDHPITPNYDVLRIFTSEQTDLDQLVESIKGHWKIRDYAVLNHPAAVPTAKVTGWRSYFRFRLPTLKAERKLPNSSHQDTLYARRLKEAKQLPYFEVVSQSTGQGFTVTVKIEEVSEPVQGIPDGYGLARKSQPFSLPVFEV